MRMIAKNVKAESHTVGLATKAARLFCVESSLVMECFSFS